MDCFLFLVCLMGLVALLVYWSFRSSFRGDKRRPWKPFSSESLRVVEEIPAEDREYVNLSRGGGGFDLSVIGESHYQQNLRELMGGRYRQPDQYIRFDAIFVPEPDNEYDPNAVGVFTENLDQVGYLTYKDAERYSKVFRALRSSGKVGRARASLIGGTRDKPSIGVILDVDEDPESLLQRVIGDSEAVKRAMDGDFGGYDYTDFIEAVKTLKRENRLEEAERLLKSLIDAAEKEAKRDREAPAPWYYNQLGIVYSKQKRYADEVELLERYCRYPDAQESLKNRLEKARKRLEKQKQKTSREA